MWASLGGGGVGFWPVKLRVGLVLAVWILLFGLAAIASPASAQGPTQQTAAERCFEHHKFGAQPVDVAKSADGQTVLAQVSWGYHDAIGCYLTLDGEALAALQAAPAPQSLPDTATDASKRCFEHHKFGERPVDVAKSADRQTVLARLSWGYHEAIGCYLTLDDEALATLRAAAQPDPTPTPTSAAATIVDGGLEFCALGTDQTIACWSGHRDYLDAPSGMFATIEYDGSGWCGLRVDQTISCWQWVNDGDWNYVVLAESEVPSGEFTQVVGNPSTGCGLRVDQTVACWYMETQRQQVGNRVQVLRDDDGNAVQKLVELATPVGQYTDISEYDEIWCGSLIDQTLSCWEWAVETPSYLGVPDKLGDLVVLDVPNGQFADASSFVYLRDGSRCGLRVDQTISCWEWEDRSLVELGVPSGTYTAISTDADVYDSIWCGLRTDQTVTCWSGWSPIDVFRTMFDVPSGTYSSISSVHLGERSSIWCGLRTNQTVSCWEWIDHSPVPVELDAPDEPFTDITHLGASPSWPPSVWVCGMQAEVVVSCWGWQVQWDDEGNREQVSLMWDAPNRQSTEVFRAGGTSILPAFWCGLGTDQTVACWPEDSVPSGWLSEELSEGPIIDIEFRMNSEWSKEWCALRNDGELICAAAYGEPPDVEG